MKASKFLVAAAVAITMAGAISQAHAAEYGYDFPYQEGASGNPSLSGSKRIDSTGYLVYDDSTWNAKNRTRMGRTWEDAYASQRVSGYSTR